MPTPPRPTPRPAAPRPGAAVTAQRSTRPMPTQQSAGFYKQVTMTVEKIAGKSIRYGCGDGLNIYLKKEELGSPHPESLTVTIEG